MYSWKQQPNYNPIANTNNNTFAYTSHYPIKNSYVLKFRDSVQLLIQVASYLNDWSNNYDYHPGHRDHPLFEHNRRSTC